MKTTLPRLELCAAVLLAKLMKKTIDVMKIPIESLHLWTDSMITLGWIKGDPARWKTFVANRVGQINKLLPNTDVWQHVKTNDNPADVISRGIDPSQLQDYKLWWQGPSWLQDDTDLPKKDEIPEVEEEVKRCHHAKITYCSNKIIEKFSNLKRMIRVLSYCRRLKHRNTGVLCFKEMNSTLLQITISVQKSEFAEEYEALYNKKEVHKKSKLKSLCPYLDENGIIRVGGRLENSLLPENQKHPIILPAASHFTKLVVEDAHHKLLHAGNQATLAYIKRKYWIINGKKTVRSTLGKCVKCLRYKGETAQQLMGQLPTPRVTPSPPFTHTGVDYAGPIQIRPAKGRGRTSYKGYIAIFVCLSTKAIHLEVVSDLSTDAFLAAFRRFTARRGPCSHMYSDNGTNFVGADKHLQKEAKEITMSSQVQEPLLTEGTTWHFIPPSAPHFGGLWEAGVKSMKHHLRRVIGESTLTYEELVTLTHQIEACLNSRPLIDLSENTDEIFVLTPGHFLVGRPLLSPPDPIDANINTNVSSRWRLVQKMKTDFWKAWSTEYLSRLQQRYKWNKQEENLKINTVVLIKEDNVSPSQWPLAKIVEVHPAKDGKIRVVSVKKSGGSTLKRPIHKLIPLPVDHKQDDQPEEKTISANLAVCSSSHFHINAKEMETVRRIPKEVPARSYSWIFVLMMVLIPSTLASYSIKELKPGFYVEHLGISKVERGTFRVQLDFKKGKLTEDLADVSTVVKKFKDLCEDTIKLTKETKCTELCHHLVEQEDQLIKIQNGITKIVSIRNKRGLLGNFLTAVFGVNDEVYKDINDLSNNQQQLIRASHQQTKLMVSTMVSINETETKIEKQMNRFVSKLNEGLEQIREMDKWYRKIDYNKLNIHLLGTYEVATNYINEVYTHWSKLLDVHFKRGTLFDLLTPAHVGETIVAANKKLPTNLQILFTPLIKTTTEQNQETITAFGYFLIVDVHDYTLIRVTAVPLRIDSNAYWEYQAPNQLLAVDYNTQLYFHLSEEEFKRSIMITTSSYVTSPLVVKSIANNPDCVIDEIYQRPDTTHCPVRKSKITSIVWKQLYLPNSWMYVVNKPQRVGITCSGIREDASINSTGIIQISQDCIIQTMQNILTPSRLDTQHVVSTYIKPTHHDFNVSLDLYKQVEIEKEPVFKLDSNLKDIRAEEDKLEDDLAETHWRTIAYHPGLWSTAITIVVLSVIGFILWKSIRVYRKTRVTPPREEDIQMSNLPKSKAVRFLHDDTTDAMKETSFTRADNTRKSLHMMDLIYAYRLGKASNEL